MLIYTALLPISSSHPQLAAPASQQFWTVLAALLTGPLSNTEKPLLKPERLPLMILSIIWSLTRLPISSFNDRYYTERGSLSGSVIVAFFAVSLKDLRLWMGCPSDRNASVLHCHLLPFTLWDGKLSVSTITSLFVYVPTLNYHSPPYGGVGGGFFL